MKAASVFREIVDTPDKGIPQDLLEKAECVAVFPSVIKAGFIVGGRGGRGVASCRTASGWSAPVFFNLGGASFGLQIGAQSTDFVMLFMTTRSMDSLLSNEFTLGADASVAAGPVGRQAGASTDLKLSAQILSYSRSKGLFAGLELKGVVVKPDSDDMRDVYGAGVTAKDVLRDHQRYGAARGGSIPCGTRQLFVAQGRGPARRSAHQVTARVPPSTTPRSGDIPLRQHLYPVTLTGLDDGDRLRLRDEDLRAHRSGHRQRQGDISRQPRSKRRRSGRDSTIPGSARPTPRPKRPRRSATAPGRAADAAAAAAQVGARVDTVTADVATVATASRKLVFEATLSEDQGNFKSGATTLPEEARTQARRPGDAIEGRSEGQLHRDRRLHRQRRLHGHATSGWGANVRRW